MPMLVAEFHTDGGALIMNAQSQTEFVDVSGSARSFTGPFRNKATVALINRTSL
jgi:hypothetical protein